MKGFNKQLELSGPSLDAIGRAFSDIGRLIGVIVTGSGDAAIDWQQLGGTASNFFVASLRVAADLSLSIVEAGVETWRALRSQVMVLDQIITAYNYIERAARASAEFLQGNVLTARGIFNQPIRVSNLAGQMNNLDGVSREIERIRRQLDTLRPDWVIRQEQMVRRGVESVIATVSSMSNRALEGMDTDAFDRIIHDLDRTGRQATMTAAAFQRQEWRDMGMSVDQLGDAMRRFAANQRGTLEIQMRDPMENFRARTLELQEMFAGIADNRTFTRAMDRNIEQMLQAAGAMRDIRAASLPEALSQSSVGAINVINNARRDEADPVRRMADNVELQLQLQREQRDLHRAVLEELRRRGLTGVEFGWVNLPPGG